MESTGSNSTVSKMVETIKNELSASIQGNQVRLKREVIDVFDAMDYMTQVTTLKQAIMMKEKELRDIKKDLKDMESVINKVTQIREIEIQEAKIERDKALTKERRKLNK